MTGLQVTTDQIGFELISEIQPAVIEAINKALDAGGTVKQIERGLLRRFGRNSLTAQMAIGAAYHIEAQRKAK